MIRVSDLCFAYPDGTRVLSGLDLVFETGSATTVIGPSGCGKTTLLYLLSGLRAPVSGAISYEGGPFGDVRRSVALILQDYGLFPWKTVWQNVSLGLSLRRTEGAFARSAVASILRRLKLSGLEDRYPSQLSGGQKQRVAVARSLVLEPAYLFMDEPFSALDALTREELQEVVLAEWLTRGLTMVMVTHSVEEAVFLGQRILVLGNGTKPLMIRNPQMGSMGYREKKEFFAKALEVRNALGLCRAVDRLDEKEGIS